MKSPSVESRVFASAAKMCNCWCIGWAEVYIRAPSGNFSWMMRIENEASLYGVQDTKTSDLTLLFASVARRKQRPDLIRTTHRIDSGSIGEEEYESLYAQHFSNPDTEHPVSNPDTEHPVAKGKTLRLRYVLPIRSIRP
jgi:hypothetical protein